MGCIIVKILNCLGVTVTRGRSETLNNALDLAKIDSDLYCAECAPTSTETCLKTCKRCKYKKTI